MAATTVRVSPCNKKTTRINEMKNYIDLIWCLSTFGAETTNCSLCMEVNQAKTCMLHAKTTKKEVWPFMKRGHIYCISVCKLGIHFTKDHACKGEEAAGS